MKITNIKIYNGLEWIDYEYNTSGSIELDTTLTVEGKAADAGAVGEALEGYYKKVGNVKIDGSGVRYDNENGSKTSTFLDVIAIGASEESVEDENTHSSMSNLSPYALMFFNAFHLSSDYDNPITRYTAINPDGIQMEDSSGTWIEIYYPQTGGTLLTDNQAYLNVEGVTIASGPVILVTDLMRESEILPGAFVAHDMDAPALTQYGHGYIYGETTDGDEYNLSFPVGADGTLLTDASGYKKNEKIYIGSHYNLGEDIICIVGSNDPTSEDSNAFIRMDAADGLTVVGKDNGGTIYSSDSIYNSPSSGGSITLSFPAPTDGESELRGTIATQEHIQENYYKKADGIGIGFFDDYDGNFIFVKPSDSSTLGTAIGEGSVHVAGGFIEVDDATTHTGPTAVTQLFPGYLFNATLNEEGTLETFALLNLSTEEIDNYGTIATREWAQENIGIELVELY